MLQIITGMASPPLVKDTKYVPVDYIRGEVINTDPEGLLSALQARWNDSYFITEFRGDEVARTTFRKHNIQLVFHQSGRVVIGGSLHKYHNKGRHNFNQYNAQAFEATMTQLEQETTISPDMIRITGLEYGVNITPPIPTRDILNRCFLHRGVEMEQTITRHDGKYIRAIHDAYEYKLYDKAAQYHLPNELFRIEVKTTNWSRNRRNGITTLSDWHKCDKTPFLRNLIDRWNDVLFADPTTDYGEQWHKYTNREYWRELREGSRTNFHRHWQRVRALSRMQGDDIQNTVANLIAETVQNLQMGTNTTFI